MVNIDVTLRLADRYFVKIVRNHLLVLHPDVDITTTSVEKMIGKNYNCIIENVYMPNHPKNVVKVTFE